MTLSATRLKPYLEDHDVDFEVIPHRLDFSAQRTASDTHTPGREFAKVVVVMVAGQPKMIVLPAHHKVDFIKARNALGGEVALASEEHVAELFPDCEVGAESPFGNLYDLPVYVTPELADDEYITFNAGTHRDAVRMLYRDFEDLVRPTIIDVAWHR